MTQDAFAQFVLVRLMQSSAQKSAQRLVDHGLHAGER